MVACPLVEAADEQGQLGVRERAVGWPTMTRKQINGPRPREQGSARSTPVRRQQGLPRLVGPMMATTIGTALLAGYALGLVPGPQHTATGVLIAVVVFVAGNITRHGFRPLAALSVFAYGYPFLTFLKYYGTDVSWGSPNFVPLSRDLDLIAFSALVGLVGLFGLIAGLGIPRRRYDSLRAFRLQLDHRLRPLSPAAFAFFALVAVGLIAIGAPNRGTIFTQAYASGGLSIADRVGFSGGPLMGFALLLLLLIDARVVDSATRAKKKYRGVVMVFVLGATYVQLLRGNRNSLGFWIAGGLIIWLTSTRTEDSWRPKTKRYLLAACALVAVFAAIGTLRNQLADEDGRASIAGSVTSELIGGTSVAIAQTEVAATYKYRQSGSTPIWGETYYGYLLSLPPQPVVDALGIPRPVTVATGPAWWGLEQGLTIGGIHIVSIPLVNFGPYGVFPAMWLIGRLIVWLEKQRSSRRAHRVLLYYTSLAVVFYWFWYGDLYIVRAAMAAVVIGLLYELRSRSGRSASRGRKLHPAYT